MKAKVQGAVKRRCVRKAQEYNGAGLGSDNPRSEEDEHFFDSEYDEDDPYTSEIDA